jgi:hypothetical protein
MFTYELMLHATNKTDVVVDEKMGELLFVPDPDPLPAVNELKL